MLISAKRERGSRRFLIIAVFGRRNGRILPRNSVQMDIASWSRARPPGNQREPTHENDPRPRHLPRPVRWRCRAIQHFRSHLRLGCESRLHSRPNPFLGCAPVRSKARRRKQSLLRRNRRRRRAPQTCHLRTFHASARTTRCLSPCLRCHV